MGGGGGVGGGGCEEETEPCTHEDNRCGITNQLFGSSKYRFWSCLVKSNMLSKKVIYNTQM